MGRGGEVWKFKFLNFCVIAEREGAKGIEKST